MSAGLMRSSADRPPAWAAAVRARRRALHLTQQDLADLADVGVRLVHEVEHGTTSVQLANLLQLLNALGLHLELARGAGDTIVAAEKPAPPTRG